MKKIICAIVAGISVVAAFGQAVRTFNSTNELVAAGHNPMSQNTNSWVINTNDMSYQMWTWFQGDTSVASTYNLESLRPGVVGRYKLVENLHWNRAGDVNGDTYVIYSFLTNFVATNVISGASIWTNDSGIVRLINMTPPVKITNSILLSDGGTNAIKLISVTDAGYTNGAADVKFQTLNGSGYGAALEAQNQSAFVTAVGGANQMGLRALSHQVTLDSVIAGFRPVVDLGEDNGVMKYAWRSNIVQHSIIRGFESGVGSPNFSILDIYQTDTNSPVVFDQRTDGTAGYSRGFSFRTNGVEVFSVTGTGGPSSGANWTAVGITDSSLAGTATANGFRVGTNTTAPQDFVVVVIPDTQTDDLAAYQATAAFITTNNFEAPLAGVIGLGDVVDDSTIAAQWTNSTNLWYAIPSTTFQIPIPGNHDYNGGTLVNYNTYYSQAYLTNRPWWSATTGAFYQNPNGENMWIRRQYSQQSFVFFGLEYNPADAILNWVSNVCLSFPQDRVVISTHDYIRPSGLLEGMDPSDDPYPGGTNNGSNMWYKCFQYIPNLCLVMNGHNLDVTGKPLRSQLVGIRGNVVNNFMADYQAIGDGMGWVRILHFQPSVNLVKVTSFDTKTVAYSVTDSDQFSFPLCDKILLDDHTDQVLWNTSQLGTNVVVNFAVRGMRLLAATNDLFFSGTNMPSLVQRTISYRVSTGTTNRNLTFETGMNGIGAPIATYLYPSNHVLRVDLQSHGTATANIDVFVSPQLP